MKLIWWKCSVVMLGIIEKQCRKWWWALSKHPNNEHISLYCAERKKNNNNLLGIFSIFLWLHMCMLLCNKTYNQMKLNILIPTPLRGHRGRKIKLFIYVHLSVFVRTVSNYIFFLAYGVISSEWLSKTLFCEYVTL